jgi:hypothetical protein
MRRRYYSRSFSQEVDVGLDASDIINELSVVSIDFMLDLRDALNTEIEKRKVELNGAKDRRSDCITVNSDVDVELDRDDILDMISVEDEIYDYSINNQLILLYAPKYVTARLELEDDLKKLNEKFKAKYGDDILKDTNI